MNISPAKNPFYNQYGSMADLLTEMPNKRYCSRLFVISPLESDSQHAEYIELMNQIHHPESNLVPYSDKFVTKSWNKMGDLLIHIEYYEMSEPENKPDPEF
jgi:hypothetical protein